ncbi:hypothetical protein RJ640_027631 [Escallonia rubra]|uniref:Uncharacterized protein n=1 Tax=Escallonia rubra TaxID=112253 RepID=A0AA88R0B3_9ASTE|nr:hypothetical protein RJ640_027631 [Escallonia rubra]
MDMDKNHGIQICRNEWQSQGYDYRVPHSAATTKRQPSHECAPRCTTRCSNTAYKKPCLFFCRKCCAKCLCVPPGTYGNKQFCPCYNNWKTKRGGPKCP